MHHTTALFNPEISILSGNPPDMSAIRAIWRSLQAEEVSASPGCRLGIARRRMELLAAFPAWRLPDIIDELNRPGAMEVAK